MGTASIFFNNEDMFSISTILNSDLSNLNIKGFTYIPIETNLTSLDDFSLNAVTFNIENINNNVSFDIRGTAQNNATGTYSIKYIVTY